MKIDIHPNIGSPIGITPPDVYGRGVGGAELAMINWAATMASRGHQVRVYNDPSLPGEYDGVTYLNKADFQPQEGRDIYIVFRSPNEQLKDIKAGFKIHWTHDLDRYDDFGLEIFPHVDKIVCVSSYHAELLKSRHEVEEEKIGYFDLGVNLGDYHTDEVIKKIPGRCIFCSMPNRGLDILHTMWPEIKERAPHASMVITSDFRLWGQAAGNEEYIQPWQKEKDVLFLGKIERKALVKEQLLAQVHSFPCVFNELFCISVAECQVAGAWPVTSAVGALPTTNQWGTIVWGSMLDDQWKNMFVETIIAAMEVDSAALSAMQAGAARRFNWNLICEKWEKLINYGKFDIGS